MLLGFGYTHCPDVCPTTLAKFAEARRLLGADGTRVQALFITIDPERDTAELLAALPAVEQRASRAFPHAEAAITAFQPNLNFFRAYSPDLFNGFAKLGQATAPYDGNGHYVRTTLTNLNLFKYEPGSSLKPISPSEQYDVFEPAAGAKRRCPGGAAPFAADGSNPFVEPPHSGSGVTTSDCNPADAPPGP